MVGGECYVMFVSRQSVLVRRAQLIILRDERQVVAADCRAAPWRSLTPGLRDKKTFIQTKVRTLTLGCISQLLDCSNILFITTIYFQAISEINFQENWSCFGGFQNSIILSVVFCGFVLLFDWFRIMWSNTDTIMNHIKIIAPQCPAALWQQLQPAVLVVVDVWW